MKNIDLQKEINTLLVNDIINYFDSARYIDCAVRLLENGYNTESLYILAGLDGEDDSVVKRYFEKMLLELDVVPERDTTRLIDKFAFETAKSVIDCKITTDEGLTNMVKIGNVNYPNRHRYIEFMYMSDDIYFIEHGDKPFYFPNSDPDQIEEFIKSEFFIFYEAEKRGIYEKLQKYIYCKKCLSLQESVLKQQSIRDTQCYVCSNCGSDDVSYNNSSICREKIIELLKIK